MQDPIFQRLLKLHPKFSDLSLGRIKKLLKKIDFDEVVVYDKDEMASASSAEKISKSNSIKVFYLEGGIQSWTENNLPLVEGK